MALIMLRGNSGSGKTTVAKALQRHFGRETLVISQDAVRRDMLYVRDEPGNAAIALMEHLLAYGSAHCTHVILEGILYADVYGSLFARAKQLFAPDLHAYYFDLPFAETVRRHQQKDKALEFGEADMQRWWRPRDFIAGMQEVVLTQDMDEADIVARISADVGRANNGA